MIVPRLAIFGAVVMAALLGWSWLRSLRSRWVAQRRGALGWCVAMLVLAFLFAAIHLMIPKV